ncbi:methyltransferase [Pseudonocardia sp. HH130630-07]|uniref:methyltransferase n=1 Tax=Pseudonocardia sp. HH130630-07 TaxID=1690815 RepID=UPI00081502AD|nr:methyltransferase [Pseudonocardia sp. HH130630-07]ANY07674.1 SAM-dependent methyltransferase [Pseudonocardia sp. HH130630-07]
MTSDAARDLARLVDLVTPFAVRTAVGLGIGELIEAGTTEVGELAAATGTDASALARLMAHLVSVGLFADDGPGRYRLTPVSRELVSDGLRWQRAWLIPGGPGAKMDLAYAGMTHTVRTGRPAYGEVHGADFWTDYERDDELRRFFGQIMAGHAWQTGPDVASQLDWSGAGSVLDIGGGTGALLSAVLTRHPHLHGAVLDLPAVRPEAEQALRAAGLADRAAFVGGSFLEPLPTGYDVIIASRTLSDWPDADAATILGHCADALAADGALVVVEVAPGPEHEKNNSSSDLQTLTLVGGRNRTPAELGVLIGAAGLVVETGLERPGGLHILRCRPGAAR